MWIHYPLRPKFKFYPITTKFRKWNFLNQLFSTQLQQSSENFDYKFWNSNYIQWQPSLENAIFLNQVFSTQLQQSLENSIFSIRNFEIHILSNDTKLRKFSFLDFYLVISIFFTVSCYIWCPLNEYGIDCPYRCFNISLLVYKNFPLFLHFVCERDL